MVVLAVTVKKTEPSPLPLEPALIAIQLSPTVADHSQPSGEQTRELMPTLLLPLSASKEALLEDREKLQVTPSWVITKASPPTMMEPDRDWILGLATTVTVTLPSPLPLAPGPIVIQSSLLEADHSQPSGEVMPTLLLPPSDPIEALPGERE